MTDKERQLLKSARKGSVAAFEQLIEPYCNRVYNLMLKACNNEFEASQLAQEVFIKVFRLVMEGNFESAFAVCIYKTADEIAQQVAGESRMIS